MNTDSTTWRKLVSRTIKAEMARKNLKYDDLSRLLANYDTLQSADNLRNKINRGILGADLYLQLLIVLNVKELRISSLHEILDDINSSNNE